MTGKIFQLFTLEQQGICRECQSRLVPGSCPRCQISFLLLRPFFPLLLAILVLLLITWFLAQTFLLSSTAAALTEKSQSAYLPKECRYLSHLYLGAEQYQPVSSGRMACMSGVRYFGVQRQHAIRYSAFGSANQVDEMRLSLLQGHNDPQQAINELIRFGNSLSLPITGRALPVSIGLQLREGETGSWDLEHFTLYIERPMPTNDFQEIQLTLKRKLI
ncbi:hypothetical protein [Oceanospirillum beijerinckii]|uniref:hypothetical protein n=1 Tax=Oceanospirillum beijerinckii TaxID=64976 RepID=UPI0004092BDB|nr:hypothetical protein [Oceanospirillum beijerinckii]